MLPMRGAVQVNLFIIFQDELQALKAKVKEIIEENKLLHEEIKGGAVHEMLKQELGVEGVSINSKICKSSCNLNGQACVANFFATNHSGPSWSASWLGSSPY